MSKLIAPYKAIFSINYEQLYLCSDIAYEAGALGKEDFFPSDKDKFGGANEIYNLSGGHLTPSQFRGLCKGEEIKNADVANNFAKLYKKLYRLNPYDQSFMEIFEKAYFVNGVPNRLGRKAEGIDYPLPQASKMDSMVKGLFTFLNVSKKTKHPILLSGMAYVEIMAIAPYSNGNLALALFLSKAILASYQKEFAYLPFESVFLSHKEEMDKIFENCAEKANMGEFLNAYLRIVKQSLSRLSRKKKDTQKEQSPQVKRLVEAMEEGKFYSAVELCELLNLKSRLGLMNNYLKPALFAKLIVRSEPLSPTSRSQRYALASKE